MPKITQISENEVIKYTPNRTTKLFKSLDKISYFCGFPTFWIEERVLPISGAAMKLYDYMMVLVKIWMFLFLIMELGAFFTQDNLNPKQDADRLLSGCSHPIFYMYSVAFAYHRQKIKNVLLYLSVLLKEVHNDAEVELLMTKKAKFYSLAYIGACTMALGFYGIGGLVQYIRTGAPFVTVVTAWPDVDDPSRAASIGRLISYLSWWVFMTRVSMVYLIVMTIIICLGCQYKNLQCYFLSLPTIFERENLTQEEKEKEFEKAFKVGIKLHSDTLWCTEQSQDACNTIFSGQIIVIVTALVSLMAQMVNSERTLANLIAVVSAASAVLISSGLYMWNAGDVTVEAAGLASAMYKSGWENCTGETSIRIRKLFVIAMRQAQEPVVLVALGIVELSYQSYVSFVKSSYSVFSVLY